MSRISYRLISIELKQVALCKINKNNLIRLNLTQKPSRIAEEYLINNVNGLRNINHEFVIDDNYNKVEKLSLTLRSVIKKTTFASIFNIEDDTAKMKKPVDHSIDQFIQGYKENRNNSVICNYIEPKFSLIGYCIVDLKEIGRGINNSLHMGIYSRIDDQIVGYANLQIYVWDIPSNKISQQKSDQLNKGQILFIDPGCSAINSPII